jgi:bidirectional [NiFe] hydrogenase diaphorase subunit
MGTACYVKGGSALLETLKQEFNLRAGETTPDGEISLATARCIGACGIAPAAVFDGEVSGKQTPETLMARVKNWDL